jgi:hypothetical protein
MPTQIGQDKAIARFERLSRRQPKFMICGERVQKDHRRTLSVDTVDDLGVAAFDFVTIHFLPLDFVTGRCS